MGVLSEDVKSHSWPNEMDYRVIEKRINTQTYETSRPPTQAEAEGQIKTAIESIDEKWWRLWNKTFQEALSCNRRYEPENWRTQSMIKKDNDFS